MSTDLALVNTDVAELDPMAQAIFVTNALVECKSWLAVATKAADPTPIAEYKAWAATVLEMTRQKGLASDIQSEAMEMVRRLERGTAQAVRNGQATGEIASRAANLIPGNRSGRHLSGPSRTSSQEFFGRRERSEVYAMTDGVSDEQFEEVLTEARAGGNLTRANVVRIAKELKGDIPSTAVITMCGVDDSFGESMRAIKPFLDGLTRAPTHDQAEALEKFLTRYINRIAKNRSKP